VTITGNRARTAAGVLSAAGGAAAAYGSVVDWATVTGRRGDFPVNATDLFASVTVAAGLACVVGGILLAAVSTARGRASLAALALAGGLVAAGIGAYVASSDDVVIDAATEEGRRGPRPGRRARVAPEPGLFVVIAGGALAVAGGVVGLASARDRASTEAAAAAVLDARRRPEDNTPTPGEGETT
jgi:hypothetical protein